MSTLFVDTINEKTSGNGVAIPGHLVQFVRLSSWDLMNATATGSWTNGASLSITPKYNNSLIHVTFTFHARLKGNQNTENRGGFRLIRDGQNIGANTVGSREGMHVNHGGSEFDAIYTLTTVDAPATTSSVTYQCQGRLSTGTNLYQFASTYGGAFTAMEIAQ